MSIEDKIDNIASNYNNIQDNLDSMDVDRYEEGKVYYSEGSIKKCYCIHTKIATLWKHFMKI